MFITCTYINIFNRLSTAYYQKQKQKRKKKLSSPEHTNLHEEQLGQTDRQTDFFKFIYDSPCIHIENITLIS